MIVALHPDNEDQRLRSLRNINILDSLPEEKYDHITDLATFICGTKSSAISLVDENRQWFKSIKGMATCETPREVSFCSHAILNPDELMEVQDAKLDERFKSNPLVTDLENPIRYYAGIPIKNSDGMVLGTLCVLDDKPNSLSHDQKIALRNLGRQVQELVKLHVVNEDLRVSRNQLKKHNGLLEDFAGTVSHDMKMPLANLIVTSDILNKKYHGLVDDDGRKYLKYLKSSSLSLSDYITNILAHYESSAYEVDDREDFDLNELLENIIELINIKHHCDIHLPEQNYQLHCNRVALEQIFLNLIGNSIKYNDKEETVIDFGVTETEDLYKFSITDNGRGIPKENLLHIFNLFNTVGEYDRYGNQGHGIGLSTVKQLVENLGGSIHAESVLGESTTFYFSVSK
ncbi:sensor histidine kinase [Nonlabens marinus]|uniref:histidine kinase n=1 Tax=Nonlabens marinus S1-08 TaxID=1454201 RepID=W8VW34_9FLAO|nr:GAF domain-containing sensor histidine kinase [Nonlabens marinus]BAO54402.1 two-component hybrid sensor and regulator [Nonlabens marinus S1-08]